MVYSKLPKDDEIHMKSEKSLETQFNEALLDIDELLLKGSIDAAYKKYTDLIQKIESKEYQTAPNLKAEVYASFAYFLFRVSEYEHFFIMLIKAQDYGYSRDEIEKVLWEAFVKPNINNFKTIYEGNINFLISNHYLNIDNLVVFEELPFWLLPTEVENKYYMYDRKQKLIKDKVSLYRSQKISPLPTSDDFSDYLLLENWNWEAILSHTNAIKRINKKTKTYILINNIEQFLSCLQGAVLNESILSNVMIFDNSHKMSEYFKGSDAFLPRNIINLIDKSETPQKIINDIHNYRISKENRKGKNILLSICIPSFNRGDRAYDNVIHLLQSYYDEEIEIILSNNGTQNETKEYYDKIRDIDDARLHYFAYEENQGFAINSCKTCELASGKFILLSSDEDLVNFNVLDKVMNLLNNTKETIAIMRTTTSSQSKPPSIKTASPGKDALLTFMLTSNYMSGIILNNKLLKQHKGIEYVKENMDNSVCFWYPHMFWELLLCQYGNVQGVDLILMNEGKAEKTECDEIVIGNGEIIIPYYAAIEGRLEQYEGFLKIFKDLEICKEDVGLFREMYTRLCFKTLFLVALSINVFYKKTNGNTLQLLERAYEFCTREELYITHINNDRNNYRIDLKAITQYYKNLKNQL